MKTLALFVVSLSGCVKHPTQAAPGRPETSAPAPGPIDARPEASPVPSDVPATVAKLFVQGRKWTFPFTRRARVADESNGPDPNAKETTTTGTVTCEVSFAGPRPHGRNTRLMCDAAVGIPLELTATRDGLWALDEGSRALDPKRRLLDEPPQERDATAQFPEGGAMHGVTSGARGRWCVYDSSGGMGQGSGWMFCVRDGELVGGHYTESGFGGFTELTWGEIDGRVPL